MPPKLGSAMSQRIPLGDVPNAANSPARTHAASKRSRGQIEAQENFAYDVQPQAKRQVLDKHRASILFSPAKQNLRSRDDPVFIQRSRNPQLTAFERKCLASREGKVQQKFERQEKAPQETLEGIRQWQKHYRKAFPQYVFYFEGVPEEVRQKCSKWVRNLGAREEKFFSKDVTHIVTSRPIPNAADTKDETDFLPPPSVTRTSQTARTINPTLLDRQVPPLNFSFQVREQKITYDAPIGKRSVTMGHREVEPRRNGISTVDILSKAQEMGMRVWQLEKLQRIMNTMHEASTDVRTHQAYYARSKASNAAARGDKEAELSRMLRNERLHGPSDRDASVALGETVPFKGPYIHVRDIDERTKPIMIKEFARPTKKGDLGEWPQFRAVSHGKCPFVEEVMKEDLVVAKVRQEEAIAQQQMEETRETRSVSRSRAATREDVYETQSARDEAELCDLKDAQQPLQEIYNETNVSASRPKSDMTQFRPSPVKLPSSPAKAQSTMPASVKPTLLAGEPAASGLQPSNITSAIRSQMISSTAACPGVKAGTSKEIHGLKRKVLERNAGPALNTAQARQQYVDPIANARAENSITLARQGRRPLRETLLLIDEESTRSDEDEDALVAEDVRQATKASKRVQNEKVSKPGYCENCRDKYQDFDEHIEGRRHRKFATSQENWKDLDRLLAHLGRPLKRPDVEGF